MLSDAFLRDFSVTETTITLTEPADRARGHAPVAKPRDGGPSLSKFLCKWVSVHVLGESVAEGDGERSANPNLFDTSDPGLDLVQLPVPAWRTSPQDRSFA